MAERLGITQQSYAYFETNPANVERLFTVLRLLDVEISLEELTDKEPSQASPPATQAERTGTLVTNGAALHNG